MGLRVKGIFRNRAKVARGKGLDLVVPKHEWWADPLPRSSLGCVSATF